MINYLRTFRARNSTALWFRRIGTVHADRLILHFRHRCNHCVDSPRLSGEVRVEGAKDHPGVVLSAVSMEAQKVTAIVRQQNPAFCNRERQYFKVRDSRIRLSGIQLSQNVMSQPS